MDFNIIMGIFGALGTIFTIYSYIKNRKIKKLIFNTESTVLISESVTEYENLKIIYNNESIKSLTSTIVRIKNTGSDLVLPSDLAPSSPIIIKTTEKFLLKEISKYDINSSNSKNIVKLSPLGETSLQVLFDFLNPKDEISITLLHTGDVYVEGDLITNPITNHTKNYKYTDANLLSYNEIYNKLDETKKIAYKLGGIITVFIFLIIYIFYQL